MRKLLFGALFLIVGVSRVFCEHNYSIGVWTNSVQVVVEGNKLATRVVVGQELTQGQVVTSGGAVYMAVTAGTLTNLPTHTAGQSTACGPTLRHCPAVNGTTHKRIVVFVDNTGTNQLWVTAGAGPATTNAGIRLEAGERAWFSTHRAIHAISSSGTTTVSTQEIY